METPNFLVRPFIDLVTMLFNVDVENEDLEEFEVDSDIDDDYVANGILQPNIFESNWLLQELNLSEQIRMTLGDIYFAEDDEDSEINNDEDDMDENDDNEYVDVEDEDLEEFEVDSDIDDYDANGIVQTNIFESNWLLQELSLWEQIRMSLGEDIYFEEDDEDSEIDEALWYESPTIF